MATLADYYIQIVPSAEGISGKLGSIMDSEASTAGQKAGNTFGSSFGSVLGTVGKVGAASFGLFTAAVGAGSMALKNGISEVAAYGDAVDKTSQKVGMSAESYQRWDYVMNLAGTSMQNCSMGMKTLTNQIDNAKNGSADAQAKFEALGISMDELQTMSREDVWGQVITGMQNMGDSTERAALANDLFGRSGQEMTPLFNMTNEQLNEAVDNFDKYNMALSDDGVKAAAAYQDSLTTLQGAISGLKNNMLADFLPGITTVMDGMSEIFAGDSDKGIGMVTEGVGSFINTLSEKIPEMTEVGNGILTALIDAISQNSDTILQAGADTIITLATSLVSNLPTLVSSAGEVLMQLGNAFLELAPELVEAGLVILENLMNGIGENLDTIIPTVTSVILEITSKLIEHLPELIQAGLSIFMGLVDGLLEATPLIIEQLPLLLEQIIMALNDSLSLIAEAGVQLFSALVQSLPQILDAITQALPEIINVIIDYYTGPGVQQTIAAYITLFNALLQALPQIISTIVGAIPQIISSIVKAFTSRKGDMSNTGHALFTAIGSKASAVGNEIKTKLHDVVTGWVDKLKGFVSNFTTIGEDLLTGLWNGMNNKVSWILSKVSDLGNSIVKKAKSIFKESSPSKVFYDIGDNLGIGLGLGWEDSMKDVNKQINDDLNYEGNVKLSTSLDDAAASQIRKASADITANIPKQNEVSLDGAQIVLYETLSLDGTNIKEIMADYTVRKIGSDMRAVKTSRGGRYGVL